MHTDFFIIGASGHAKVVMDALYRDKYYDFTVWDDNEALSNQFILKHLITVPIDYSRLKGTGHIAVGCAQVRQKISLKLEQCGISLRTIIHPLASISNFSKIGQGCFIASKAVVAPNSFLGKSVIVNHGAVVDHDCCVGDFSHIAPNATLGGGVIIGKGCLIGAGAVILSGIKVVDGVTIGAGAVVVKDVLKMDGIVMGVPAK